VPGVIALFGAFMIMVIILAVLALIVVKALAGRLGHFHRGGHHPIALFMGVYSRYIRPGRIGEVSVIGFVLLMLAIFGGQYVQEHAVLGRCSPSPASS
jgi:carbon starvation protein